jgi:hypothetical protein
MWGGSSGKNSGARGYRSAAPHCMLVEIGDQPFRVACVQPCGQLLQQATELRSASAQSLFGLSSLAALSFPWHQE